MLDNTITLSNDDPTLHLFEELRNRAKLSPIERADKTYELLVMLHKTSSTNRPQLNGNSRAFMVANTNMSKSLISQYLSIHKNITSQLVREAVIRCALAVRFTYLVSLVRGKNAAETEILQLATVHEFTTNRRTTEYRIKRGYDNISN